MECARSGLGSDLFVIVHTLKASQSIMEQQPDRVLANSQGRIVPDLPRVSVIVLNRNNAADTQECLASLNESTYPNIQLVVVDNDSDDGSAQEIAAAFPDVKMLISPRNLGYAGGMNIGIREACADHADYVLLLNNDTTIDPAAIAELLDAAESQSDIGICVPKIYFYHEANRIWSAGARWRRFPPRVTLVGFGRADGLSFDRARDLDFATGCALLVRREVIDRVGLFDEGFFMYQEDYDYCARVRSDRWVIRYAPSAKIWHKVSAGLGSKSSAWWYWWGRSTIRLYRHSWQYSWIRFLPVLGWIVSRELVKRQVRFVRPMFTGMHDEICALQSRH